MNLLFVAYYFPPLGLSGVLRPLKFVKYLAARGWNITVLTASQRSYYAFDPSLTQEIPGSVIVERTPSIDLHLLPGHGGGEAVTRLPGSLGRKMSRLALVPDSKIGWYPFAVGAGLRRSRQTGPDVVMATGPPWTSFLVGRRIAGSLNLPLVLDYRDSWLMDVQSPLPTGFHRRAAGRLESGVVGRSSGVITVNETVRDELRQRYPSHENEILTIYNGFDPEDFERLPAVESPFSRENTLGLIYLGTLYQDVNVPVALFRALARLRRKGVIAPEADAGDEPSRPPLEVVFVGVVDPRFVDLSRELGISDLVGFHPYRPHREALAALPFADAALLLVDPHEHADRHVPGKLYEYLGARLPVVALAPAGSEAARIVGSNGAGIILPPDDVEEIGRGLERLLRSKEVGEALPRISASALCPFDRRLQAEVLHEVLERALGSRR